MASELWEAWTAQFRPASKITLLLVLVAFSLVLATGSPSRLSAQLPELLYATWE